MFVPGIPAMLTERFAATHDLKLIGMDGLHAGDIDAASIGLARLSRRVLRRVLDEGCGAEMSWLHMAPKARPA